MKKSDILNMEEINILKEIEMMRYSNTDTLSDRVKKEWLNNGGQMKNGNMKNLLNGKYNNMSPKEKQELLDWCGEGDKCGMRFGHVYNLWNGR